MTKFRLIWENITFVWEAVDMVLQKQTKLECRLHELEEKQNERT